MANFHPLSPSQISPQVLDWMKFVLHSCWPVGQPNHVSQNSVMDMMVFDVMIQHGRPIAPVIYTIIIVSNIESIAIKGCFSNQTTFTYLSTKI